MIELLLGKYRNIVVSIALFLILDASVLMLNFYVSFEISEDAAGVNTAGRQRMLSQRMVKSLFDIQYTIDDEQARNKSVQELANTISLFDTTLSAFDLGATITGADGKELVLDAVSTDPAIAAVDEAKQIWFPYKRLLDNVVSAQSPSELSRHFVPAIAYAREHNLQLLSLMNGLTVELESVASSKATRLRIIQTVGISLAIINFFIILFHFLRQLKESDRKVEHARKETQEILETVGEGLFLLNKDLTISSQYSKVLETMLAREQLGGINLEALLGDIISDKNMSTAKRFIGLLFRADIKSNLIQDLNPLSAIEVNISTQDGQFVNKFLKFSFERVYDENGIKDVLVTVVDITDRVLLERELAATKEQNERQLEVLTSILHANPDMLNTYVNTIFKAVRDINDVLREPTKTDSALRKKLSDMFVEVHRLKGEASALGLQSFEDIVHDFEQEIIRVRESKVLVGDDFLPLVVRLEKLVKHTESVQGLMQKLSGLSKVVSGEQDTVASESWSHLRDLADTVAKRCDKQIGLVVSGFSEISLTEEMRSLINDVAIQGVRNAITHGIETFEDRANLNKPDAGRIDLCLTQTPFGTIELSIKDDGYGIDVERIRRHAIASGQWSEAELEGWDAKRLMSLIFEPGFTTAKTHTVDAGSGVGMDVIRQRVNAARGKIRIHSRRGIGTKISVVFPSAAIGVEAA